MQTYVYKDQHEFAQAAFDHVAQIVANFGEQIVIDGSPTPSTEKCLKQLAVVCSAWGYSPVRIIALTELFEQENAAIFEHMSELGDEGHGYDR